MVPGIKVTPVTKNEHPGIFKVGGGIAHENRDSIKDIAQGGKTGFLGLTQAWKMTPEHLPQADHNKDRNCSNPLS